ncbi:MAG: cyclic nucleotide-binding domain-containing protein [Myxococcota bacterium]
MSEDVSRALLDGPIGQVLNDADASEIASMGTLRTLAHGEPLFVAGSASDALFVVVDGSLQVLLGNSDDETPVATLSPGQLVGELEVMTKTVRVASVAAQGESKVLVIPVEQFDALLSENRASGNRLVQVIAKTLARRLAAVNQRLTTRATEPAEDMDEVVEIVDTDVTIIEDDDLDVLDKLWS